MIGSEVPRLFHRYLRKEREVENTLHNRRHEQLTLRRSNLDFARVRSVLFIRIVFNPTSQS